MKIADNIVSYCCGVAGTENSLKETPPCRIQTLWGAFWDFAPVPKLQNSLDTIRSGEAEGKGMSKWRIPCTGSRNIDCSLSGGVWSEVPDVTQSRSSILSPSGICDLDRERQSLAKRQISYPLPILCHIMSHASHSCQITRCCLPLSQGFFFPLCPQSSDASCFVSRRKEPRSAATLPHQQTHTSRHFIHQPWRSMLGFALLHMVRLRSKVPEEQMTCSGSEWWMKVIYWGSTPPFPQHPLCASGRLEFQVFSSIRN